MNTAENSKSPTIFVIEQQPFDYTPAQAFGSDIVFLDVDKLAPKSPSDTDRWNGRVLGQIRKRLADYIPGYDFIIPTGQPARMLLAGMVLAEKGKIHKLLGWDKRTQRYLEYVINL